MLKSRLAMAGVVGAFACAGAVQASPVVYDFEGIADATPLTTQLSGLSFVNAYVLTADNNGSLSDAEFPPHSGIGVVFDVGGAIEIQFGMLASSVAGYFTYALPLTFEAFDSNHNLLATMNSVFSANRGISPGPLPDPGLPNEFISYATPTAQIASVRFTADIAGASFALDDLTVDFANNGGGTVPEPQSLGLALVALAASVAVTRRRRT